MRRLIRAGLALALVFAVSQVGLAQSVKLRPLGPIYVDGAGTSIKSPHGVACKPGGTLIVADTGNARLAVYSINERGTVPTRTVTLPGLRRPIRAEAGAGGELFVLDGTTRRIARLGADGQLLGHLEPKDATDDFAPRSFRVGPDGSLWVLDLHTRSVRVFGADGVVRRTIPLPAESVAPADLTLDPRGTLYVIDSVARTVFAAAPGAAGLTALGETLEGKSEFPTAIEADDAGRLYVADQNGGSILVLGVDGSFRSRHAGPGWKDGLLRYPSGLCLDGAGHLFVADRANDRVQVFAILQ